MSFFAELKRRNVFKVGIAYAIIAWLLIQVAAIVLPTFDAPRWVLQTITFIIILGFPLAVFLAWAFELTPEGVKRTGPAKGTADPVTTPTDAQSIAVLPFVNMSSDPEQEYFSDGISEELLNQLSKIKDLHVAGRTSSFYFKGRNENLREISEKLAVAHILEGSVRKSGNRVRVTAQLIKAADGYHLWSDSYDRELDDIFTIQDEIAHAVTDALRITLGVGNLGVSTRNIEAYDAYLTGLCLFNQLGRENATRAIENMERAVALDPTFIEALSTLAHYYYYAGGTYLSENAGELLQKLESTVKRATSISPDSLGTLRAQAALELSRYNWLAAERYFKKVLSLAPDDMWANRNYASCLEFLGRPGESIELMRKVTRIEPLSPAAAQFLAVEYEVAGDLEASLHEIERGQGLHGDPDAFNGPLLVIALTKGDRAMIEAAFAKNIKAGDVVPDRNQGLTETMYSLLDKPDAAIAELHRFYNDPAYHSHFIHMVIAFYASYFGDHALALDIFRKLLKSRSGQTFMIWRPIHKPMRQLPDFKDLVRDMGLVDYWRATGNWGDFCRPVGDDDFECT
jgi:TolB-like protein